MDEGVGSASVPLVPYGVIGCMTDFATFAAVFLIDYNLTRKFASNLRGCVDLAQEVAQALARYSGLRKDQARIPQLQK